MGQGSAATRLRRGGVKPSGRALIVGATGAGAQLAADLRARPGAGITPVAFLDEDRSRHGDFFQGLPVAGAPADLARHLAQFEADTVFLCAGGAAADALPDAPEGVVVYTAVGFYEKVWRKIPPACVREEWLAEAGVLTPDEDGPAWERGLRRVGDVLASSLLLLLLSPILLLAALAVKVDSPGPVLYSQMRSGKGGRAFRLYKFRSMRTDAEKAGAPQWAQVRDPRVTRVGRLLRLTRIDELPQFWNVLRGDMSLIGPRPERPEFDSLLAEQIPHYQVRYQVRPGISGWAQVMYPYGASVEDAREKMAFDLYYLKNRSLLLDVVITLRTVQVVLFGKGR
jgi:exopolysaccharide biosynthesis polyprenyl glycosylphosphotransferase